MDQAYIGTIVLAGFNFAPMGWAICNGQTLPINQNQALFALLGTTYGGDGVTNFKLPNLNAGALQTGLNYYLRERRFPAAPVVDHPPEITPTEIISMRLHHPSRILCGKGWRQ